MKLRVCIDARIAGPVVTLGAAAASPFVSAVSLSGLSYADDDPDDTPVTSSAVRLTTVKAVFPRLAVIIDRSPLSSPGATPQQRRRRTAIPLADHPVRLSYSLAWNSSTGTMVEVFAVSAALRAENCQVRAGCERQMRFSIRLRRCAETVERRRVVWGQLEAGDVGVEPDAFGVTWSGVRRPRQARYASPTSHCSPHEKAVDAISRGTNHMLRRALLH